MNKIQYRYTHIAKQAFVLTLFLYTLLQCIIMAEIIIYKIPEFYEATNIPLTIVLYLILFTLLFCLFRCHKFCYSTYDSKTLTYHNTLLRKTKTLDLSTVKAAIFDKKGVKFYTTEHGSSDDAPDFFLPFFRGGIVQALQIDKFYKMMKADENIKVQKTFKILPGYTKKWKFLAIAYGFLAVVMFMNCATPLTVIIVLFQSH